MYIRVAAIRRYSPATFMSRALIRRMYSRYCSVIRAMGISMMSILFFLTR